MADIVGVDHVRIGTHQFDSRGCVEDYTRWVHLVVAMLRGGFTPRRPARSPAATTCGSSAELSADGLAYEKALGDERPSGKIAIDGCTAISSQSRRSEGGRDRGNERAPRAAGE
jgi:hypothetical protein